MAAERTIMGVDFSGAKVEGKTWVAKGCLSSDGQMAINHVQPVLREDLIDILTNVPVATVVALDFPFGLPRVFLESLNYESLNFDFKTMKSVWPRISEMGLADYRQRCKAFGWHPKRAGDSHYPVSMSALNTRLVPMTYHGIRMLHGLDQESPDRWWIPPLDCCGSPDDKVTLLEVMPGAFLRAIGFDHATVKGYKDAKAALETRDHIIGNLAACANVKLPNLADYRWGFRANEDCLDAVIAAIAAASWALGTPFLHPTEAELMDARLEGWIYAPESQVSVLPAPSVVK